MAFDAGLPPEIALEASQTAESAPTPIDATLRADRLLRGLERLEALRNEMTFRLVQMLDASEPDPDLEPSLGAPENPCARFVPLGGRPGDQRIWASGRDGDEREDVSEDEGAQCDGGGGDDACEDEGGACEDEGADIGDYEPDQHHMVPEYDPEDQRKIISGPFGFAGSHYGV